MNEIIPKSPISIRPATLADVPFIDSLQKLHSHQVGWMPTRQLQGKIDAGQVIVADGAGGAAGYCIGQDRYFKRDDVGIIYQMNVSTGRQRELVGASLLKAQFERSAWGCKLYCCWCAQDIAANRFWEAMGFVPLAFRAGSEKKSRVHIFWQRRICSGDATTPYWFPSQTTGGSIREDRLVLPIPPGTHWADVMPRVLPGEERVSGLGSRVSGENKKRLPGATPDPRPGTRNPIPKAIRTISFGGLRAEPIAPPAKQKPAKEPRKKRKNDPRLVAAARELRDRWMEQVNTMPLIGIGKYEVSRAIAGTTSAKALAA